MPYLLLGYSNPPHFRLLELGGGDGAVERGAQVAGGVQRQLHPGAGGGAEAGVEEVQGDDIAQRGVAGVVVGDDGLGQGESGVAALGHAFGAGDLDDRGAHGGRAYAARCLPKKAKTLAQPSIACSGR